MRKGKSIDSVGDEVLFEPKPQIEAYIVDFGFARLIVHMPLSADAKKVVDAMTQAASKDVIDWWYVSKKEAA